MNNSFEVIDIFEDSISETEKKELEPSIDFKHLIKRSQYDGNSWKFIPVMKKIFSEKDNIVNEQYFSSNEKQDELCDNLIETFAEKSKFRWFVIRMLKKYFPEYVNIGPLNHATKFYHNSFFVR